MPTLQYFRQTRGDYKYASLLHTISDVDFDFEALGQALDCQRDFYGVGIIYSEDQKEYVVRQPRNAVSVKYVIVTKVPHINKDVAAASLKDAISTPSLSKEITSTVLSCGGLLLTIGAAIVGTGAVPFTLGASSGMVALAVAGTIATTAQCVNGIVRVVDMTTNEGEITTWLDSQQWYLTTSCILDIMSVASAGAALKDVLITYRAMRASSSLKVSQWLRSLPRQDRARITKEIMRIQNPGISNKAIKSFIAIGKYPKRFPTEGLQKTLQVQLLNSLNSMAAFSGSAIGGVLNSPASILDSGEYVVGMLQSIEVFE
ncbi:hypothetical protein GE278_02555 [Enterobacteriaceae bacterium Kacie_13]|nr:hypothetical protein GE278_02555 [Enterobacteriaceae bacterium Kacie_13]